MLATLTPTMDDARAIRRTSLTGLEPRKKDVIPEILPPEIEMARVVRTVLVVDVVESVRLMQEDEAGTVQRWRAFVDHVVHRLLPGQDGRLVKSLGDGLMLEFSRVAHRSQRRIRDAGCDRAGESGRPIRRVVFICGSASTSAR